MPSTLAIAGNIPRPRVKHGLHHSKTEASYPKIVCRLVGRGGECQRFCIASVGPGLGRALSARENGKAKPTWVRPSLKFGADSYIIAGIMATDDPESERQRLIQRYASMSEGELRRLAEDAGALSEPAVQALAEEAQRRGLDIRLADSFVPIDEVEARELVVIRQFRDLPDALLAKGALDSAGIECFLVDDNMVRLDWFISNLLGGVKLAVKEGDAEDALDLLEQPVSEDFEADGAED